jgi:excisionase family DNA binding protein
MSAVNGVRPEPFWTVAELSAKFALSKRTVRDLIHSGELPAYKFGRTWRIRDRDVERWQESHRLRFG